MNTCDNCNGPLPAGTSCDPCPACGHHGDCNVPGAVREQIDIEDVRRLLDKADNELEDTRLGGSFARIALRRTLDELAATRKEVESNRAAAQLQLDQHIAQTRTVWERAETAERDVTHWQGEAKAHAQNFLDEQTRAETAEAEVGRLKRLKLAAVERAETAEKEREEAVNDAGMQHMETLLVEKRLEALAADVLRWRDEAMYRPGQAPPDIWALVLAKHITDPAARKRVEALVKGGG